MIEANVPRTLETPSRLDALRSAGVTMGPSLVVILWLVIGTGATIGFALVPPDWWRVLAAMGTASLGLLLALRLWYLRWGATDEELDRAQPGDAILSRPVVDVTRAVTVEADAPSVWAWLAQIGQGRGGLYSYDWLENLAGLDIHSVDRIVPELQRLRVGDPISLGPGPFELEVATLERERALVLRLVDRKTGRAVDGSQRSYVDLSWAFILAPIDGGRTRLISRFRLGGRPRRAVGLLYSLLIEIPHFVMERKMLLGIKRRAERGTD
jgi:hypothetical protein